MAQTRNSGMCMDARRSTSRWIIKQQAEAVVAQRRVVGAAEKLVVVAAAEVGPVVVEVAVQRLAAVIARGPQFPVWRLSMRCLQPVPIPMWRLAHVGRRPAPVVVLPILC